MSRSPTSPLSEKTVLRLIALVAITLLGKVLLDALIKPLQLDEFATWWIVQKDLASAVFATAPYNPHPLFYALEWLTVQISGPSTQGLRILSYVSYVATFVLILRFVQCRLALSWQVLVAIFLTMQPLTELINARPYQLGFLFSAAAMVTASHGLNLWYWGVSLILCSLAFLTHQSFVASYIVPVAFYLYQSDVPWGRRACWIGAFGGGALLVTVAVRLLTPNVVSLADVSEQFFFTFDSFQIMYKSPLLVGCLMGNIAIVSLCVVWLQIREKTFGLFKEILRDQYFQTGVTIIVAAIGIIIALSLCVGHSLVFDRYMLVTLIGYILVMAAVLRVVGRYEVVLVLLCAPLLARVLPQREIPYDQWDSVSVAGRPTAPHERILSIVYSGHPFSRLVHYNQDERMSSAWTSPLDFYVPQSESTVTLPMVEGAIEPAQPAIYRLPWTSVDLRSFRHVEIFHASLKMGPIGQNLAMIQEALARNCFVQTQALTRQVPIKYSYVYDPSRCVQ